ncbi:hypothetical protein PFISCL1PPCAC_15039 [Pristionchus fissidentatus]|uniref:Uncharacterized protein n=1 Tax=Pristionchus fissidentatus TaxID=1538716 RepID=A0AAV5W0U1_9BILA|nr:hypothetical protein PFISCL1PPCAC_15039 [Pristionchus fissidentatus]
MTTPFSAPSHTTTLSRLPRESPLLGKARERGRLRESREGRSLEVRERGEIRPFTYNLVTLYVAPTGAFSAK